MGAFYRNRGKRLLDVLLATVGFAVTSPVLLVAALVVRVHLGSPVLFRQARSGRGGIQFTLVKFRTMTNATDTAGRLLSDNERLTSIGRILRATSIDELPSLWNVMRGEMSIVGPRPLLTEYLKHYTQEQARRLVLRPGMTGLAQVRGRNAISWEEKFRLDCDYVDRLSFPLDVWILWLTPLSIVRQSGISASGHATMPEFNPKSLAQDE